MKIHFVKPFKLDKLFPPRFLLNCIVKKKKIEERNTEKIVLKWKIVQNYRTNWKSSKIIDIY